jgi:hypothetical protein
MTASITRWQLRLTALLSASNGLGRCEDRLRRCESRLSGGEEEGRRGSETFEEESEPALEIARLILAKSTWHPEWARENVGAQTVQKLVSRLVEAASGIERDESHDGRDAR